MSEKQLIQKMLTARSVAVVGLSDDPSKPSHRIARYLIDAGFQVFPVNPGLTAVMGLTCCATLRDVPVHIDLVNVFRRSEFIPAIVEEAIAIGAGGIWVQSGIRSQKAAEIAQAAGIAYIQDRCIMVEHANKSR